MEPTVENISPNYYLYVVIGFLYAAPVSDAPRPRRPYAARMPLEQRREQLMDAALRLIVRDGYGSVTVEAVAQEAGVTKPVVYGAYAGLDQLLIELLDRQQGRALKHLLDALPLGVAGDPRELVSSTVRAWAGLVLGDHDTWRPILLAREGTPAAVWTRIEQGREQLRSQLELLLRPLVNRRSAADAGLIAHALVAAAERYGQLLLTDPGSVDIDRLVATVQVLVTAAVPPPTSADGPPPAP